MSRPEYPDQADPGPNNATGPVGDAAKAARATDWSGPRGWTIEATTGSAQWFHDRDPTGDTDHRVWIHRIPTEAIVLGSAQNPDLIRSDDVETVGLEVCRRRSGGGLVHIQPGSDLWIDIIIPRHSSLWDDDVGRSFHWLGRHWASALERHYADRTADLEWVVATRPVRQPEGRLLCFADVGHGEVLCCGRKVVGLSQRRTRRWARLQALLVTCGRHHSLLSLLDARSALDAVAKAATSIRLPQGEHNQTEVGDEQIKVGDESDPTRFERRLAAVLHSVDQSVGLPAGCPPPDWIRLIGDFCHSLPAV